MSHLRCDGPWHLGKEAEHNLREGLVRDVMLQEQHLHLCVLLPCSAQTSHKVTLTVRKIMNPSPWTDTWVYLTISGTLCS